MLIWEIKGYGLPTLTIKADSFDEAIEKARVINKNYCSGRVIGG